MQINPPELVQLVVWHASRHGDVLTTVRVVKFLYLADLYHARAFGGRTLTGWPWAFVHFGPFCSESMEAISTAAQGGLVESKPYASKYTEEERFVYGCDPDAVPRLEKELPNEIILPLRRAVKRWADDTGGLLDHVYFETEPMIAASRGRLLDFSLAEPSPRRSPDVELQKLPREKIQEGRRLVDRLKTRVEGELRRQHALWVRSENDPALKEVLASLDDAPVLEGRTLVADLGEMEPESEETK